LWWGQGDVCIKIREKNVSDVQLGKWM